MQHAYLATPEKALLDLFYLTSGSADTDYICELRLQRLGDLNSVHMAQIARHYKSPRLMRAVRLLEQFKRQTKGSDWR